MLDQLLLPCKLHGSSMRWILFFFFFVFFNFADCEFLNWVNSAYSDLNTDILLNYQVRYGDLGVTIVIIDSSNSFLYVHNFCLTHTHTLTPTLMLCLHYITYYILLKKDYLNIIRGFVRACFPNVAIFTEQVIVFCTISVIFWNVCQT